MYPPGAKRADIEKADAAARARPSNPYERIGQIEQATAAISGNVRQNENLNSRVDNNDVFLPTMHNTIVSGIAGFKKVFAMEDREAIDAASKWQEENSVRMSDQMNQTISRDYYDAEGNFNAPRFVSGVGTVIASAVTAIGGAAAGFAMGGPGGAFVGAGVGAGASYGLVYNELLTESISAGLPLHDAVTFSHMVAAPMTLIEALGARGLGKALAAPMIKSGIRSVIPGILKANYGKATTAAAGQVLRATTPLAQQALLMDAVRTGTTGLRKQFVERLIATGGVSLRAVRAGAMEEFTQSIGQQVAKSVYDRMYAGQPGKGDGFNDRRSKIEILTAALDEAMYGGIVQGGFGTMNIMKPVYEASLYGTLTKMDAAGRLDEGIEAIRNSFATTVMDRGGEQSEVDGAMQTMDNVIDSYRKMGSRVMKPESRYDVFRHIQEKKNIEKTSAGIDSQIESINQQLEAGTFDRTLADVQLKELEDHKVTLDKMMALTNDGMVRASDTFVPIMQQQAEAEGSEIGQRLDASVENAVKAEKIKRGQPGSGGIYAETVAGLDRLREEAKRKIAQASGQQVENETQIFGDEEFHENFQILQDYTRDWSDGVKTVVQAEGESGVNYFVAEKDADGNTSNYRMVPNVPLYRDHLDNTFANRGQYEGIAQKLESGVELTVDEAIMAKESAVEIAGHQKMIVQDIQRVGEVRALAKLQGTDMSDSDRMVEANFPDRVSAVADPLYNDLYELSGDLFNARMRELSGKPSKINKVVGKGRMALYGKYGPSLDAMVDARFNAAVETQTANELENIAAKMATSPEKAAEYVGKNVFRQNLADNNTDKIKARSEEIAQARIDAAEAKKEAEAKKKEDEKAAKQAAKEKLAQEKADKKKANDTEPKRPEQNDDVPGPDLAKVIELTESAIEAGDNVLTAIAESPDPASTESGVLGQLDAHNRQLEQANNEFGQDNEQPSTGEGDAAQQPGILANSLPGTETIDPLAPVEDGAEVAPEPATPGPPIGVLGSLRQKIDEVVSIMNHALTSAPISETKDYVKEAVAAMRDQGAFVTGFDADGNPVREGAFDMKNVVGSYAAVFTVNTNKTKNIVSGIVYKGADGQLYIKAEKQAGSKKKVVDQKLGATFFILAGPNDAKSITGASGVNFRQMLQTRVSVESAGDLETIVEQPIRGNQKTKDDIRATISNALSMVVQVWKKKTTGDQTGRENVKSDINQSVLNKDRTASAVLEASGVDKSMMFYRGAEASNDNLLTALLWADSHDRMAVKKANDENSNTYIPDMKRKATRKGATVETVVAEGDGVQSVLLDSSESTQLEVGSVFYVPSFPDLKRGDSSPSPKTSEDISVVNQLGETEHHNTYTVDQINSDLITAVDQDQRTWILDPRQLSMISLDGRKFVVSEQETPSRLSVEERRSEMSLRSIPLGVKVIISADQAFSMDIDANGESEVGVTVKELTTTANGERTFSVTSDDSSTTRTLSALQGMGLRIRNGGDASSSLVTTDATHKLSIPSSKRYGGSANIFMVMDGDRVVSVSLKERAGSGVSVYHELSAQTPETMPGIDLGINGNNKKYSPVSFSDIVDENGRLRPEVKIEEKQPRAAAGETKKVSQAALDLGLRVLAILKKAMPNINVSISPADFQRALGEAEAAGSKLTYLETNNGVLYGFEWNGAIYFNPEYLTGNIAIHEFGHIWKTWAKFNSPQLLQSAMDAVRGTTYEAGVRREYTHLDSDEAVLDEAFARALGDAFNGNLSGNSRLGNIVNRIWNMIREALGLNPTMTLGNITDQVLSDLLGGNVLTEMSSERAAFLEGTGRPEVRAAYVQGSGIAMTANMDSAEISRHYDGFRDIKRQMKVAAATPGSVVGNLTQITDSVFDGLTAIMSDVSFTINDITGTRVSAKEVKAFTRENLEKVIERMSQGRAMPKGDLATLHQMAFAKNKGNLAQKYHKWFKSRFASVVDDRGNSTFTRLNSAEVGNGISHVANTKALANTVAKRKAFGMLFSDTMSSVWNFDTLTKILGNNNFITGLHNLRFQRNADASAVRAAMFDKMKMLHENYREQSAEIIDVTFTNQYGVAETRKMSVSEAIQIQSNYKTQIEHADQSHLDKNGTAMPAADKRKASTLFYDPSDTKYGLRQRGKNGEPDNRGVRVKNDDDTFTHILFTEDQLARFEPQFLSGNYANFFTDLTAFFNDQTAYDGLNSVYKRLNGKSLARVADFFYPLYGNSGSGGSIQEISKDPESLSILTERSTAGPVRLSNRDVFRSLDKYNGDMFDYIANSEVVDGLGRYWGILNSNPDVVAASEGGNVEAERQKLATFAHDFTLRLKNQDRIKYKLTNQGVVMGFTYAQLMGNFARSVFTLNLANPLKQMTGFFSAYGMGIIEDGYLNQVAGGAFTGTLASYRGLVGLDDTRSALDTIARMKANETFQDGYLRVMGADSSSAAGVEFADNQALGSGVNTPFQNGKSRFSQLRDWMSKHGMEPMRRSDREVITRFYVASELKVADMIASGSLLDASGNKVIDINSYEGKKEIGNIARKLTYATNQMFMDNDKTISQLSDSPWIRALGIFSSQPQKMANTVMQTVYEALSEGTFNLQNQKLKSSVLISVIGASAWTSIISIMYGILRNGYDEEKDYAQEFLWSSTYNMMGMAPTFNTEIAKIVLGQMDNLPWDNTLGQDPVLEIVSNAAASAGGLAKYISNPDDKMADRVLEESIRNGFDSFPKLIGISDGMVKYFLKDPALSLVKDDD